MAIYRKVKSLLGGYKGLDFPEIIEEELTRTEGHLPTYISMLGAVQAIGGGNWEGFGYKESVLKAAGWEQGSNVHFYEDPQRAVMVLNNIRLVLAETTSPDEILERLVTSAK